MSSYAINPQSTPLPRDCQIRDVKNLVGHTIKAVIENPTGPQNVDVVIVTETGCWLALNAEGGSYEDKPYLVTHPPYAGGADVPLEEYLSAQDALLAGLVNQPTYELLRARELEAEAADKKARAEKLRRELAALEGGDQ